LKSNYQVFISFKNSNDQTEEETPDKAVAYKVYKYLSSRGLNVFFSPVTLKALGRDSWQDEINLALKESKVFIALGTTKENMNAHYVKKERDFFGGLKLIDESRAMYGYIASPMRLKDVPDDISKKEVFQDKNSNALVELYTYIRNHLARDFNVNSNVVQLFDTNTLALSEFRQKLLISHSLNELKRLLYEVEQYQSQYPHCVDAKIIKDSINKAISNTQEYPEIFPTVQRRRYNIKKIIYITSSILILFPIIFLIIPIRNGVGDSPIVIHEHDRKVIGNMELRRTTPPSPRKLFLKIKTIPSDAKIRILNIIPIYKDIIFLPKGIYIIEVSKEGYKTKIFDFTLEKDSYPTIILEKKKILKFYKHKSKISWTEAKKYCHNLDYKGYDNWRLPTEEDFLEYNGNLLKKANSWTYQKKGTIKIWLNSCESNNTCLTFNTHPFKHNHFYYIEENKKERKFSTLCVKEVDK